MKVKLEHIRGGFETWYIKELAPLNWKLYFGIPLVRIGLKNAESQYNTVLKSLLDENGEIDIDELHKEYKVLLEQSGGAIDIGPLKKVNTQDLDKLVGYIKQITPPKA